MAAIVILLPQQEFSSLKTFPEGPTKLIITGEVVGHVTLILANESVCCVASDFTWMTDNLDLSLNYFSA